MVDGALRHGISPSQWALVQGAQAGVAMAGGIPTHMTDSNKKKTHGPRRTGMWKPPREVRWGRDSFAHLQPYRLRFRARSHEARHSRCSGRPVTALASLAGPTNIFMCEAVVSSKLISVRVGRNHLVIAISQNVTPPIRPDQQKVCPPPLSRSAWEATLLG